jgi:hypothetical protein
MAKNKDPIILNDYNNENNVDKIKLYTLSLYYQNGIVHVLTINTFFFENDFFCFILFHKQNCISKSLVNVV